MRRLIGSRQYPDKCFHLSATCSPEWRLCASHLSLTLSQAHRCLRFEARCIWLERFMLRSGAAKRQRRNWLRPSERYAALAGHWVLKVDYSRGSFLTTPSSRDPSSGSISTSDDRCLLNFPYLIGPAQEEICAMTETASKPQIILANMVIVLLIAFGVVGLVCYGASEEVRHRFWEQLLERPGGPMTFRFILQPIMAAIAALHDGIKDAKTAAPPTPGQSSPIQSSAADACTKD